MNVERLRMVKDVILKYPEETNMRMIHSADRRCHCIFGWSQVLFSPRFLDRFWRGRFAERPESEQEIFQYLGMSYVEARRLYHLGLWPDDLRTRHNRALNSRKRAEITAEAIERFIADPGFKLRAAQNEAGFFAPFLT